MDILNDGRDPRVVNGSQESVLSRAAQETLINITCGDGEQRCFVLTEFAQLGLFLPTSIKKRDSENNLLISWDYLRLVPPDWYSIAFVVKGGGTFRAVPDAKLSLEDYPKASRSSRDPETADGFATRKDLRLVLRPQALRFFWYGLHEPLVGPNAWPSARAVMMDGFVLKPDIRAALAAKLSSIRADRDTPWLSELRATLSRRHWPSDVPQQAAEPPDDASPSLLQRALQLPQTECVNLVAALLAQLDVTVADEGTKGLGSTHVFRASVVGDILDAADAFRERSERTMAPDVHVMPDERSGQSREVLFDGSVWAYDLDSATQVGDGKFGFTRILQIVRRCTPGCTTFPAPAHVTVHTHMDMVAPQGSPAPQWAEGLMESATSYHPRDGRYQSPITQRWHDTLRHQRSVGKFWAEHECRVWQFSSPRSVTEGVCDMNDLHWFLVGEDRMKTFSSSLCKHAAQVLRLDDSEPCSTDDGIWELGTWDVGSEVRALLPFYEPMRQATRARNAARKAEAEAEAEARAEANT